MPRKSYHLFLAVFCALLCGAFCCAHPKQLKTPAYYHATPLVRLQLHADVEFTPIERSLIAQVANDLEWQTAGWLKVEFEYDLNMMSESMLQAGNFMIRQPEWTTIVFAIDMKKGARVLGFTVIEKREVFIVVDRLPTVEVFRHVVMHELLHAAGLDDLPNSANDIMSGGAFLPVPLCLSRADAEEFCRVNRCEAGRMNTCS